MPPLLPGLMQEAPGVSLQSIATDPFRVCQLLEEERIDVAVSVNKQSRGEILRQRAGDVHGSHHPVVAAADPLPWSVVGERLLSPGNTCMVAHRETGHGETLTASLASQGLARRVRFATQNFSTFPLPLTTLPLFATVPGRVWRGAGRRSMRCARPLRR
ncbi:LysR substrate-binding domain-containing protein [Klebsiella pneumoniae]|nr:LysR substrate-binding domain-containing protein [Klebsiella pneumoniae]